jgi:hypothetical protein
VDGPPFFPSGGATFGRAGWSTTTCGSTAVGATPCPALDPLRDFLDGVGGQPFFAWFAPMLPHVPYDAPPAYRAPLVALGLASYEVDHLSSIRWFDELLGELLLELDRRGLRDDTLIIYAADNGWGLGFQSVAGSGRGKGTLYDLGFRTPIIVNQPGVVPAGGRYDDFVSLSDLPATILDYAGVPIPAHSTGSSLRSRVSGGAPIGRAGLVMFAPADGAAWVDDQWRYLRFDDGSEELYRIDLDPWEQNDLAAQHPELLAQFGALVEARRAELTTFPQVVEAVGRVQDANGQAIAGGRLAAAGGPHTIHALTGADGWFRFAGLDAPSGIRIRPSKGIAGPLLLDAVWPIQNAFTLPGLFHPIVAFANRPLTAPLGGSISGRVLDPTGAPIPDAKIRVFVRVPEGRVRLTTISQADGSYAFENLALAPGYGLLAAAHGFGTIRLTDLVVASPVDPLDVGLVLEPR